MNTSILSIALPTDFLAISANLLDIDVLAGLGPVVHHVEQVGELAPAVHEGRDEHGVLGSLEEEGQDLTLVGAPGEVEAASHRVDGVSQPRNRYFERSKRGRKESSRTTRKCPCGCKSSRASTSQGSCRNRHDPPKERSNEYWNQTGRRKGSNLGVLRVAESGSGGEIEDAASSLDRGHDHQPEENFD